MARNGISTLETKELRQIAKLDLAAAKRGQSYDRDLLPTKYVGNVLVNNPNVDGLQLHRPWISGPPTSTYVIEFRSVTQNGGDFTPGNIITQANEGDIIWFDLYGSNIPVDETAYIQFSGANITAQDISIPFIQQDATAPISVSFLGGTTTTYPDGPGAPVGINADNLTEGNETLTLSWIVLGDIVASASITIVDTSTTLPFAPTETINFVGQTIEETNVVSPSLTLYARASSFQVDPHDDALIAVNGVTLSTIITRGHTLRIVDSEGGTGSATTYDTYGDPTASTMLADDLNSIAPGYYIVLTSWDACALTTEVRTALNTGYGTTDTNTWTPTRYSHIVIAKKL